MDFLKGLNPQQKQAVSYCDGPLLILAGAGSGKTRVITHRICHLIRVRRVPGGSILAVTFTNKAAGEMRDRVLDMLGGRSAGEAPLLSTFHSFCVRLLRGYSDSLSALRPGFRRDFLIYDDDDQLSTVKAASRQVGADEKAVPYRNVLSRISHAKNQRETFHDWERKAKDKLGRQLAAIWEIYEEKLLAANALDFDDLLLEAVRLLRHDDDVRDAWNRRVQHFLIDEYQDTNRTQYELMRLLSEQNRNVCAVGDEDQSIYGWRGADIGNILDFERDFPDARTIRLEQNYRSTKCILEAAGAVVARNERRKGKSLWTEAGLGRRIGIFEAPDAEAEALFIAEKTESLLADDPQTRVAVIYRTNAQSRQIEEALRRHGREYVVVGGLSFYRRAEIRDILSYLKLLVNPEDPVSLYRVINKPARGIGRATVEQIDQYARDHRCGPWSAIRSLVAEGLLPARSQAALDGFRRMMEGLIDVAESAPLDETVSRILEETGYRDSLKAASTPESEARIENLGEFLSAASEAATRGEGPAQFLDHAALISDADGVNEQARVSLLTLHNAKGLEWPAVFIAGMEDGLFPHSRSATSEEMMEEERRLCYVGMTRAEKHLFLSWARRRRRFGAGASEAQVPSRFLAEVPREYVELIGSHPDAEEMELMAERAAARETAHRNAYTGKTYNSVENVQQFFRDRGLPAPEAPKASVKRRDASIRSISDRPRPQARRGLRTGATVEHPRFGKGTLLRREGEGDDAKLTISFPGYGLKKLIAKYADLKVEE